MKSDVTKHFRS